MSESIPASELAWRERRANELRSEDSWLALAGLHWLDREGCLSVGSAADNDIVLESGPPRWGQLLVTKNSVQWRDDDQTVIELRADEPDSTRWVRRDACSLQLIARDGMLALRLRDSASIARRDFGGLDYFPYGPEWGITARWDGKCASFAHGGNDVSLTPLDTEAASLQFVIADATSGRETYGGGRFLFVRRPETESLILDFNRAINPPCVFTPYATCPVPPPENRLPFAVTAGEKIYR